VPRTQTGTGRRQPLEFQTHEVPQTSCISVLNAGMAFITKFFKVPVAAGRRHSDCECGWSVTQRDGVAVLQLDTYGSKDRKLAQKVSQSIQLDRERAIELASLIDEAFPGQAPVS
jgi:hypothetical protein